MADETTKPLTGLWRNNPETPEGKYLVMRRDGTIPEWPCFPIGAADPCAPAALRAYAEEADRIGLNQKYVQDVLALADEFESYLRQHGPGDPDRGRHREDNTEVVAMMKSGRSA